MSITATTGESKKDKVTAGSHAVMLVRVVDLGTQPGSKAYPDPKRKLEFMYEVMDQSYTYNNEVKPMGLWETISPVYVSEKKETNYHKKLNSLFGKTLTYEEAREVDFEDILGTIYTAQVEHNGEWVNIGSIVKAWPIVEKHYAEYIPTNDQFVFSLENFDETLFNKLNDKKKEIIKSSPEYKKLFEEDNESGEEDWLFAPEDIA